MNKINSSLMSNPKFIEENLNDLCASIQNSIIEILLDKVEKAIIKTKVNRIAIAGGVSANSYLRKQLQLLGQKLNFEVHIPKFEYCTDNAAMIAMAGAIKFEYGKNSYKDYSEQASARLSF